MIKHGEPWRTSRHNDYQIENVAEDTVALANPKRAAQKRIVQCVNACAGIEDPKAAIDAAREALGMLLDSEERSSKTDPDVMPCDEYIAEAYAKARAALAILEDKT